jgi:hypothetical protein
VFLPSHLSLARFSSAWSHFFQAQPLCRWRWLLYFIMPLSAPSSEAPHLDFNFKKRSWLYIRWFFCCTCLLWASRRKFKKCRKEKRFQSPSPGVCTYVRG